MDELIKRIIEIAKEYKQEHKRSLGVTGEIGEHIVSEQFDLQLADYQQEGYDAKTKDLRKVQIKSRIFKDGIGRVGKVKDGEYDKLLVASFDDDFKILDAYVVDKNVMEKEFEDYLKNNGQDGKNLRNPSWSKIQQIGTTLKNKDGSWGAV
ncbi:MAG: hypothetical protein A2X86_09180 [Bdellovibrionales bacterium GWA2_49_15]|nr:MAG: hypothetical protein A2X86_09180 [Bdellovibrionales bacterium GWA2_49_15]HAZ12950.1 hypothetical protein [Bdellovibrionales bacterium]